MRLALWRLLRRDAGRGDPETVQQGPGPPSHAVDLSIFQRVATHMRPSRAAVPGQGMQISNAGR